MLGLLAQRGTRSGDRAVPLPSRALALHPIETAATRDPHIACVAINIASAAWQCGEEVRTGTLWTVAALAVSASSNALRVLMVIVYNGELGGIRICGSFRASRRLLST